MSGLGRWALGRAPYGIGSLATAEAPGGALFRDQNGIQRTGRRIDPRTRRYVLDANGRALGIDTVPQLVQLAITTVKNSSAVDGMGNELSSMREIGTNFAETVEALWRGALERLVQRGLVEIVSIETKRTGVSGIETRLAFRDLTTNEQHDITVSG